MPAPNKSHRQSLRRHDRNRPALSLSRSSLTAARAAITSKPGDEETAAAVKTAVSNLARAGRKRVVHKNNASRHISRLMKAANKASSK